MTKINMTLDELGAVDAVDFKNKPSQKSSHSREEWVEFFEKTEGEETLLEVRQVRSKLGKFTLRFMMEAVYGDEYAAELLGETGGDILMEDVELDQKSLEALVEQLGGDRTKKVAKRVQLKETRKEVSEDTKMSILRILLERIDPKTLKKALLEQARKED